MSSPAPNRPPPSHRAAPRERSARDTGGSPRATEPHSALYSLEHLLAAELEPDPPPRPATQRASRRRLRSTIYAGDSGVVVLPRDCPPPGPPSLTARPARASLPQPHGTSGRDPLPLALVATVTALAITLCVLGFTAMTSQRTAYIIERPAPLPASLSVRTHASRPTTGDADQPSKPVAQPRKGETTETKTETEVAPPPSPAKPSPRPRTRAAKRPAPSTSPTTPTSPVPSVDCLLDPSACADPRRPETAGPAGKGTKSTPTMAKPDATAIRNALAPAKLLAKGCGARHGATGLAVKVRLSVVGKTGRVQSAAPLAPHDDALGQCVADALAGASFPKFTATSVGVLYTVRL